MSSVAHCYGTCGRPNKMTNIGLSNYLLIRYKGTKGGGGFGGGITYPALGLWISVQARELLV